jgi:hypothetical protein
VVEGLAKLRPGISVKDLGAPAPAATPAAADDATPAATGASGT